MPLIYLFLAFFGFVVLDMEVLSLFGAIRFWPLLLSFVLFSVLVVVVVWKFKVKVDFRGFWAELKGALVEDKALLVLFLGLCFMLFISFVLASFSPPTEADASSYHALRALFWARDGFISHFEVADVRCHVMPINSELFYTWVLVLFKNDCCFGLLQFFSYFLLIVSSFKVMEHFGVEFKRRLWGILIFSSFAGVISQISSTQTDLCVGALLCSSLCLILKRKGNADLFFSALAMGLSFGVKSTGVIGSIPLIIYYIFILKKDFVKFFLFLVFNALVFSSYNYVLNYVGYGNVLGAQSAINEHSIQFSNPAEFFITGVSNLIKYFLSLFDFSGLALFYLLSPLYDKFIQGLFGFLHINPLLNSNGELPHLNAALSEQLTGLGVLGFLALLPAFIKALFKKDLRPLCLVFLAQAVLLSFSLIYFPTTIRFFVAYLGTVAPIVLALTYKKGAFKKVIFIIALFYLVYAPLFLVQRPFLKLFPAFFESGGAKKIRNLEYKFFNISKKHILLKEIAEALPEGSKAGVIADRGFMLYPVKYSDYTKKANVSFLNLDSNPDFSEFDFIIFERPYQEITAVKDFEESKNCRVSYYNKRPVGKICLLDSNILKNFAPYKSFEYRADDFLKKTGNDADSAFYVLKNIVTKY